jgi:hypothetical protein
MSKSITASSPKRVGEEARGGHAKNASQEAFPAGPTKLSALCGPTALRRRSSQLGE